MNIVEAYREAKKSSYKIINADKTRIIDFCHKFETVINKYDEKGNFIDSQKIDGLEDLYVRQLLDILIDDWEVVKE